MDKLLVNTYTIVNHPITKMKEKYKQLYIRGIGKFLHYITHGDRISKMVFELWSRSILGEIIADAWNNDDLNMLKECVSLHRTGFIYFNMKHCFLFDCFYLLEKSRKNLQIEAYGFLRQNVCGHYSRKDLEKTYNYIQGDGTNDKIPEILKNHRLTSIIFANKRLKRILIVATMSAGKSTLVNSLVGHKICRVKSTACTSQIHQIFNKPAKEGALVKYFGDKLNYTDDYLNIASEEIDSIGVNFTTTLSESRICIIDTPGVNYNGDKAHGDLTRTIIKENNYDLLVLVMNATQLAIDDEMDLIDYVGKYCKRKVIGVLNQCDNFKASQNEISKAISTGIQMLQEAKISNPQVIPISAQAAYLHRQHQLYGAQMDEDDVWEYEQISKKMQNPFYNLPSYLPGVPRDIHIEGILERSGLPYLENIIAKI